MNSSILNACCTSTSDFWTFCMARVAFLNGSVHASAARWKSTIVAVKVVEHSHIPKSSSNSPNPGVDKSDPASAEARVAREMLLSTSISHPNVVATYKICTIRVGSVPDSGFLGTASNEVRLSGTPLTELLALQPCLLCCLWASSSQQSPGYCTNDL